MNAGRATLTPRLRVDRHELAGAFGDIGTDLPLLIALIASCGLDVAGVCILLAGTLAGGGLAIGIAMLRSERRTRSRLASVRRRTSGSQDFAYHRFTHLP